MDHNPNNNSQRGVSMNDLLKKLDKILENQNEQGMSIVRIETYQKTYKETLLEVKKDHDTLELKFQVLNAKVNKAVGGLTALTFILPFLIKYFGAK